MENVGINGTYSFIKLIVYLEIEKLQQGGHDFILRNN